MAIGVGTGATLSGATTGAVGNLQGFSWSGWQRPSVDVTVHATTGGRAFITGDLYDPGTWNVTLLLDEALSGIMGLIDDADEAWTLTVNGETFICNGQVIATDYDWPIEDVATVTLTIKLTGTVTGSWDTA